MKKIIFLLFFEISMSYTQKDINQLFSLISKSKTVLIGAGSGLSTSAGFTISGERYKKYFKDFINKYHLTDMYMVLFILIKKIQNIGLLCLGIYF